MKIDLGTIIITIINFGILYLILAHFFFKPVNNVLDNRTEEITSKIKNADDNEKKSQQLLAQHQELLKDSKKEGKGIVAEYRNKAQKTSDDIIKDAEREAQLIISRAKTEAKREKEKAEAEIKGQVVDLAVLVSSKALEESIDNDQHRKLIKDFIAKVGI
ncbi:F0F1 ATP synthase subunit B [Clostridium fermenticellae]|uniref:ATP synthase subunit b n=1 Tax=Clostridium fermenticellae TaxID=2068654 RepID=A0A386H0M4_9CLOT|nr:F0F1 ATP synthase subunit B [Clostridium fermenticellae]AYD39200.1 F0F1 ATP synthase subunit B [Clostridium fermenticellae]